MGNDTSKSSSDHLDALERVKKIVPVLQTPSPVIDQNLSNPFGFCLGVLEHGQSVQFELVAARQASIVKSAIEVEWQSTDCQARLTAMEFELAHVTAGLKQTELLRVSLDSLEVRLQSLWTLAGRLDQALDRVATSPQGQLTYASDDQKASWWWLAVACDWPKEKGLVRTRAAWAQHGLHPLVRGLLWRSTIGNDLGLTLKSYTAGLAIAAAGRQRLVQQRARLKTEYEMAVAETSSPRADDGDDDKDPGPEMFLEDQFLQLIDVDAPRTSSSRQCSDVLSAYACYQSGCGYAQGMSYLVELLFQEIGIERPVHVFIAFANLAQRPLIRSLFQCDVDAVSEFSKEFNQLLAHHLPAVAANLQSIDLDPSIFLLDWWLTLFAKPLQDTPRLAALVFDWFLLYGDKFLFKVSLSILKVFEQEFAGADGRIEAILPVLKRPSKYFTSENQLIDAMKTINV